MSGTLHFLSANDVRACLDMKAAIGAMKTAFMQLSSGEAQVPLRLNLPAPEHDGTALFMPVYLPSARQIGLKVVTVYPRNRAKGLAPIDALVMVMDGETGTPLAIMDGEHLTALRTGAASGLATDLLAWPNAETLFIFGAGVQARTQLEAVLSVRPLKEVWIYDPDHNRAVTFAEAMTARFNLPVTAANSPAAIREADIICTATPATRPVFDDGDLKPGTHINAIGGYTPDMVEVPPETVKRARVVVDQREACLAEAGDLRQPLDAGIISELHIAGEIGELAAGQITGRRHEDEITFFKSVGNAVQDLAVASLVLAEAEKRGLGVKLQR